MQEHLLGDYQVLKTIGQGPLGAVLLAEHRFIKKHYILKLLPEEFSADRSFIQRFEEEIARIAQLDHPHIVKLYNVSFAEGVYFLVTDCVVDSIGETTNLAQYMSGRKERLREDELLHVLQQIADALDYAHHKVGVQHRALKLNNVLVGKGKLGLEVYISDFGLAKILSAGAIVSRTFKTLSEALGGLPVEKNVKGGEEKYLPIPIEAHKLSKLSSSFLQSFAFLAPEQKRFEPVGAPADIYAFGVLVYYLISGHFPEGIFPLPSKCAPEYKRDWDRLVCACLDYSPDKRPKSLIALLDQITKVEMAAPLAPVITKVVSTPAPIRITAEEQKKEKPTLEPLHNFIKPVEEVSEVKQKEEVLVATLPKTEPKREDEPMPMSLGSGPIVKEYHPEVKSQKSIEPLLTEMILIQKGEFLRGSKDGNRDEMPQHSVNVDSFAIDIHPVTNEQFVRFIEFVGGEKDQNYNDLIRLKDSRINRSAGKLSIESGYAKHPVVGVTWHGAVAYAKWIGKRLPTEAEWEIAARGGLENFLFPTGEMIEKSQANFFSSDTTPVMSYEPNGYGLYDMAGNVYEWCQDWYGYNYYETSVQEPHNPKGPVQGVYRVLRGGCWKSLKEDLRCSHRHRNNPNAVNGTYGFRCASDG